MPQPLPILKRKIQIHLTINKNINKHRKKSKKKIVYQIFFSWNWKLFQFQCLFLWNYYTFLFWCTYKKKKKTEKNFVSNYHHQISSWKYIIKKGLLAFFEEYIYIYFINNWLWNKNSSEDHTFWPQYPWHHQPPIIKFLFLRFLFCFFYHTFSFFFLIFSVPYYKSFLLSSWLQVDFRLISF